MIKYIVGKNDRDTDYKLKWLESFDKKKWKWVQDRYGTRVPVERAFHFDSAKEAKVVAKELKGFVGVIEKKWVWEGPL